MKRTSIVALTLLASLATLAGPGCSAEAPSDTGNTNTAGTAVNTGGTLSGLPSAGTASTPTAGTPSGGGTPATTAGAGGGSAGTASAGTAAGGTAAGGTAAGGSATGGTAGTATGGTAAGGTGTANPACPAKIDSAVMCTAAISCPATTCGAFKLGARDCTCTAATGPYTCTPCSYAGKTEPIVQKPEAALPACTADDTTLEKNTPTCTKGDRCASLTAKRFCACWTDPVKGSDVWDCDAVPAAWN